MEHITNKYGMECNDLELTLEEYRILDKFLLKLGVRSRITIASKCGCGESIVTIQAENVYKSCISGHDKEYADRLMDDFHISCYKR